jgi:hypothetical protein
LAIALAKSKVEEIEDWRSQRLKMSKIKEVKDLKKSKFEEIEDFKKSKIKEDKDWRFEVWRLNPSLRLK